MKTAATATISVSGLTKRFGDVLAVDDLGFTVSSGKVTGFLGPNGAGKTTTIRMLLGLARPDAGDASVAGLPYRKLPAPAQVVGTLLDGAAAHPKRTARDHLRVLAAERGVAKARVAEALAEVDLSGAADRRVGDFSLGMRQRLGLAAALLAEPQVLILDEPANGLDPAGIRWLRSFLRDFAGRGGTVFVSSHQLAEISQLADEVVVINRGRFVTQQPVGELTSGHRTLVRSPDIDRFRGTLNGAAVQHIDDRTLIVEGISASTIGEVAAKNGIVLHELTPRAESLEDVFLALTMDEGGK
jgi:ABC-2 type transport system ATP-binding protein